MPGNDGDKIAKRSKTMTFRETDGDIFSPQVYGRVQNWIRRHDFQEGDHEPNFDEPTALASCKTRSTEYDGVKVEQRTEVIKCMEENSSHEDLRDLVKPAKRASKLKIPKQRSRGSNVPKPVSKYSQFNLKSQSAPPVEFAVIMEGNEPELPENVTKPSEFSIKSIKTHQPPLFPITTGPPSRPSSRHKRHADLIQTKPGSLDRKQRKKRATLERTGPSVDHESKLPGGPKPLTNTNAEEDIASKIKSLQDKWSNKHPTEKKPKDLMRAIGKIETSDWNIQQIEKKIIENKIGKPSTLNADKERVPRWSKEEFLARQTKMEKKHLDRQDSTEAKYADIDRNIKQLDLKLKEGMNRELGQNKVATITEKLVSKVPQEKEKLVEKPVPAKPVNIQSGSEFCHFCNKRVYLMERLSAEGRFFHHGCFKCQYCHSQLRLGSYMFDRDGQYGYRFFCIHHYGMQGELPRPTKLTRKPSQKGREVGQSPQKKPFGVTGVDLLDRVQTPERIEVSNLSSGNVSSDHEDHPSQMDEDEWTDKNFGQSCNELDESDDDDDSTSSVSDTDSDDEAAFDDALEQPVTKEGTMKWAERWKNSYRKGRGSDSDGYSSSDHSSYCENSSDESDSDTATEGEDEIRARELRKQEVRVDPPVVQTDTGTDTEVKKLSVDILPANLIISTPDILRLPLNKTPSGISLTTSDDVFNSAESDLDLNMNKTVASLPPVNPLSKSATAGNLIGAKPKRNFVLPPREQRKSFGQEFTPKYKLEEPLLVIKRTPSKVSMPKEIKPKVAVNTKKPIDTKKYFGAPRAPLKKAPLVKQSSLPETEKEILATVKPPINFEVKDSDFEDIDDYLEDLLKKEEELENPPPPEPEPDPSGSIEDLFSALEQETKPLEREQVKESEEKLQDLLKWMEELDHQEKTPEITRKNDNIAFFETIMGPHRGLSRSKTEIRFNRPTRQPRTSVDLDAVKKVNIKSVLKKFESLDREDGPAKPAPERPLVKRFSLGSFNVDQARENLKKLPLVRPKPIANTIKKFEASKAVKKATKSGIEDPLEDLEKFVDETIGNIGKGARLGRSGSDWCVNVTVSSKVSPEFLRMQLESARENVPEPPRVNNEPVEVGSVSVDALETSISLDVEASNPCQKNPEREDVSERIKEEQNLPLEIPTLGNIEAQRSPEEREIKGDSKEQVSEAQDPQESSEFDASNVQQTSEKGLKDAPVISLDFSEELRQFDEAISALTDTSGSSDLLPPHNFSKAVQSSSSSSSLSSEYKKESNMPQDFAKAINSDSKEEEEEVKLPPLVPKRKKHLQPVCPRRHRSSTASPQPPRRRPEARRGSASDVEPPKAAQTGLKFPAKFGRKDKDKDCVIQ